MKIIINWQNEAGTGTGTAEYEDVLSFEFRQDLFVIYLKGRTLYWPTNRVNWLERSD